MRSPLAQRSSSRRRSARQRRAAPHWQRVRSQARLGSIGRGEVVISFHLADRPILDPPARLDGVAIEAVVCHRRARTAAEHAERLSAQELRPAGANASRCRTEARGAQHGRDRGGRDADPELQQLTLDAHVAPPRVLPRHPLDQAARLGRKRGTAGPRAAAAISLQQCSLPAAKCLRADRKARAALGREQAAHRGKQGPVAGRVLRPFSSAPEDR